MMRKLSTLIVILVLIGIAGLGWWNSQLGAVSSDTNSKVVVIPKGEGISAVAERLYSQGLIRSALAFKIYAKLNNLTGKLQAGSFKLSPSQSVSVIADSLTKGTSDIWVTLIEGWRVEEEAAKIKADLGLDDKAFLKIAKEGYMFPDTYLFPKEATVEFVSSTLRNTFDKKYTPDLQAKIKKQGLTPEQGVILASLVEREARSDEVRTMVAGILLKRLNIGMGLDTDATIQYALGYQSGEKSWWKRNLTKDDLKINSPYNTYLYKGLPPTPICNPSLSSLEAVANANPNVPYLYYYHDSKGNSYYAKTLEEQNQNAANHP